MREVFQNNRLSLPLTSLKQNSVKSGNHRSDIGFGDPFERDCSIDASVFLNNRGVPKSWILVASLPPKTKLCKIWQSSMSLRSTTTRNIMLVVFGDMRGVPKSWILVASLPPKTKLCKIWQSSMSLRSTTTRNIMPVLFSPVHEMPQYS